MKGIHWREWTDEAFEESRASGKPVLLAISAVWCHWCHVMDHTTYSDPSVAAFINEHFIPIRVDNDRSPDINSRYNMGGWPSTVFLTSERDVITGGTYIPPHQMLSALNTVSTTYTEQRESLIESARSTASSPPYEGGGGGGGPAGASDVDAVLEAVRSSYDRDYGGFGSGQKFPFTPVLELLLLSYEHNGAESDLEIVAHTLDAMIAGDIFDPVEGGMFRYATQRDWTVPHYEKMLEDNARMVSVLLDAYRLTGRERFRDIADGIFRYLETVLADPATGAFFGSQDADEEYYKLDAAGRRGMTAPRIDTALYVDTNALTALAYVKRAQVLQDPASLDKAKRVLDFLNSLPPGPDGTAPHYFEDGAPHGFGILADQAYLALANAEYARASGDQAFLQQAEKLAGPLVAEFRSEHGGLYDISRSRAQDRGLRRSTTPLPDNAAAARCLVSLASQTSNARYLTLARGVLDSFSDSYTDHGIMAADFAIAVSHLLQAESQAAA